MFGPDPTYRQDDDEFGSVNFLVYGVWHFVNTPTTCPCADTWAYAYN